jgi:hypothetical protein
MTTFLVPKNNANGKLSADISTAAGSLVLQSGEGVRFPSTFPYHISIDAEILQVTARTADTMTVTRAQEGTSAAIHKLGANVQLNFTAKALTDIHTAVNTLESAKGAASGLASLNASVKVVEQPASITDHVLDEDNMSSNSNSKVPTQQSVKAYADSIKPINRLAGVTPTQNGGWNTAPTDLDHATDGDWTTQTGFAKQTALAAWSDSAGNIVFDMGAVYNVNIRGQIGLKHSVAWNTIELRLTGDGGIDIGMNGATGVVGGSGSALAEVKYTFNVFARTRNLYLTLRNVSTQQDCYLSIYEIQAIDLGV